MSVRILEGDCLATLRTLPDGVAQTCVTSPPYYLLRDYGHAGQIGLEDTPDAYVARLVEVFREVRRVLRDTGTLWLNLGDSYAGTGKSGGGAQGNRWQKCGADTNGPRGGKWKPAPAGLKAKDLIGIPGMAAFALRADGWFLRSDIIWAKPAPMPESIKDRPTSAHEHVFLLSKAARYLYDAEAIKEPAVVAGWDDGSRVYGSVNKAGANAKHGERTTGRRTSVHRGGFNGKTAAMPGRESFRAVVPDRNARNVWTIATQPYSGAHFATMPRDLAERCIKAGSKRGDTVLDPFGGAGTTGLVADRLARHAILCEINPEYARLARERIMADSPLLAGVA